ncbi:toxin-antitoxin system protein [Clostridium sp. CAG:492]|jgi:RHH-type rel operon transcriptional repressor/antitoxin RelB|nr:toxin-antitoxin system protein [Clostridium sp. CAG:492]
MTISVRLSEEDTKLIKAYAEMNNTTLSDLIRNAIIEKIEDEYDLKCYEKAIEEYKKNPVTYTHEQVAQLLELE